MRRWTKRLAIKVYFKMVYFLLVVLLIIFAVIIPLVFFIKILGYIYPYFFWGGINVPSTNEKIEKMVELLAAKPGQKVVDLGAGDGRLLIALAKSGARAYGYEINPLLVSRAQKNIRKAGLEDMAFIYIKNMWKVDLKDFDAVVVYPMKHIMKRLEEKFDKELKPGARVVSNYFKLPNWVPDVSEDNVYLYVKRS